MSLRFFSRATILGIIVLCMHCSLHAQDYRKIFGADYEDGVVLVDKYSNLFNATGSRFNIKPSHLKAIVFPELIRYNTVYDFMEITSLKVLYITNGHDYANFSVGYLQMKPSFAEQLEKDAVHYLGKEVLSLLDFDLLQSQGDSEQQRRRRVERLSRIEGQLQYLALFYKICEAKFMLNSLTEEKRVRFLAACYNAGYQHTSKDILKYTSRKMFYTGRFLPSSRYCYSDISLYWFRSHAALEEGRAVN